MQNTTCPICGSNNTAERLTDGILLSACGDCFFEFSSSEQIRESQCLRAEKIAAVRGLFSPAEIKAIRKSYRLKQPQFEKALGVGKKTVIRWEAGTIPPSGAANSLLWIAQNERSAFAALATKNCVPEVATVVAKETHHRLQVTAKPSTEFAVQLCVGGGLVPIRSFTPLMDHWSFTSPDPMTSRSFRSAMDLVQLQTS